MGYRYFDNTFDPQSMLLDDTARKSVIKVDNGSISRIAIPCLYSWFEPFQRIRRMHADHCGWPSPGHPDNSSQEPASPFDVTLEIDQIDLSAEGYDRVEISLYDPPEGLSVDGTITAELVNLTIASMCPDLETESADVPFSVFAVGTTEDYGHNSMQLRDVVTKGIIRIMPGPISHD